ncbi:hypothetical protein BJY01DRAFT_145357 [Aspergillus pseudoustus]|uniref:Uncharacterized protein n=1 Tax=Aspergillus pseudoustus TaxID=1810923 RepID=A0ABR4IFQ9_9EURO
MVPNCPHRCREGQQRCCMHASQSQTQQASPSRPSKCEMIHTGHASAALKHLPNCQYDCLHILDRWPEKRTKKRLLGGSLGGSVHSLFFSLLAAFETVCTTFLAFFRKCASSQGMSLADRVSLALQCGVVFKFGDGFPSNSANAAHLDLLQQHPYC